MATTDLSYNNIISVLQSTIKYNIAEIDSLEGSTNSNDVARIQKLTDENKQLQYGIDQIHSNTTDYNDKIDIINDLTNNNKSVIVIPEKTIEVLNTPENIVLESDETNSKKINKNRPETIKGCFNSDTLIRHKKSGFEEFCIYIVNEGCLFRCDQNGIYDKNSIRYSKLNQFTSDNYKKNLPNRTQRNNAYVETEYLCKISNIFLPLIDLQKGTIYN